nr:MAG TPA: hypothetical protein [Caudoviricetes sp.]
MKFTENFNLNLPDLDDMADVENLNENFQTIDTKMKSLETDPELAANVVDIKNKIGTESDADTQPTLFGRLAQLKNVLLEKLAEVLTKVTGIDGKIGTIGDTAEDETLFGKLSQGAIKSVQRGVVLLSKEGSTTVTIGKINPNRAVVFLDGGNWYHESRNSDYRSNTVVPVYVESITETSMVLTPIFTTTYDTVTSKQCSWQVLEF